MHLWRRSLFNWRWLGLTSVVLLLHVWLLDSLPAPFTGPAEAGRGKLKFVTLTQPPLAANAAPPAKATALAQPKPRPHLTPRPPPATEPMPLVPPPEASPAAAGHALAVALVPASAPALVTTSTPEHDTAASTQVAAASAIGILGTAWADAGAAQAAQPAPMAARGSGAKPLTLNDTALPASARLVYQVRASRFPYRLAGELLWRNDGNRYQALLRYSVLGLTRAQTSRGSITPQGLMPERFSDKYRSEVAAHFNYPQAKVTFSANTPDAPLLAGAQDRLSVLIQLGALLASNPGEVGAGRTLSMQTVGARAADVWTFTIVATEALSLPGGNVESVKLERLPREQYDQKVEVWLAPQLGYLPARIRITEANGDSIDQLWQATEPLDADPRLPETGAPASGH